MDTPTTTPAPTLAGSLPLPGDPAPWFVVRSPANERFHFDTVAGRYVVLCFYGSAGDPYAAAVLAGYLQQPQMFDGAHACFFGVSIDPEDERSGRAAELPPSMRQFWDFDGQVSRLYGRLEEQQRYARMSVILDERLRVYASVPFGEDPSRYVETVLSILASAPKIAATVAATVPAPVLILPRVFEPALCRRLMDYYDEGGATDSGFMREINGKTVGVYDYGHKRRSDKEIEDEALRNLCMGRIRSRVVPEIRKAYQFQATRIERHIVACYEADTGGHFRAHRDNTTKGTAHRRFAVSLVLNSGEFEGGRLRFPEFGQQTYSPPPGGAVVFSCSLLHEATAVTRGRRFCYLPFLYDDAAARVRQENFGSLVRPEDTLATPR